MLGIDFRGTARSTLPHDLSNERYATSFTNVFFSWVPRLCLCAGAGSPLMLCDDVSPDFVAILKGPGLVPPLSVPFKFSP
jgi:hypothetical protein